MSVEEELVTGEGSDVHERVLGTISERTRRSRDVVEQAHNVSAVENVR